LRLFPHIGVHSPMRKLPSELFRLVAGMLWSVFVVKLFCETWHKRFLLNTVKTVQQGATWNCDFYKPFAPLETPCSVTLLPCRSQFAHLTQMSTKVTSALNNTLNHQGVCKNAQSSCKFVGLSTVLSCRCLSARNHKQVRKCLCLQQAEAAWQEQVMSCNAEMWFGGILLWGCERDDKAWIPTLMWLGSWK
jgi:hypothetical protein